MVGPADFTTNDECGVLLEGHERTPLILSPWTHRYYPALLEGAGMAKAMDLLMWELHISGRDKVNPVIWKLADQVRGAPRRSSCGRSARRTSRPRSGASWRSTTRPGRRTGASCRSRSARCATTRKQLKPFLDENWAYVAEKDGETVGAALTLPDYNQVLLHLRGRILPFGWAKFLRHRRKIDRVRVFALGREAGVAAHRA